MLKLYYNSIKTKLIINRKFVKRLILRVDCFRIQILNGSPVYPSGQVQIGIWFTTAQLAPTPHEPGQGSEHFVRIQARWLGHSECIVHSGLQLGGVPINVDRQEQDGFPLILRHSEYGPQGDGRHGFCWIGVCDCSNGPIVLREKYWTSISIYFYIKYYVDTNVEVGNKLRMDLQ